MRYIVFFVFLFVSSLSFAIEVKPPGPHCPVIASGNCTHPDAYQFKQLQEACGAAGGSFAPAPTNSCNSPNITYFCRTGCSCQPTNSGLSLTPQMNCECAVGLTFQITEENPQGKCLPELTCPNGQPKVYDPVSLSMVCSGSGDTPPQNCPSGFPPVNGQCPVCIGGQNPDGTCQDDGATSSQTSNAASTPTSTPTSAPASTPNTSNPTASTPSSNGSGDDGTNPSTGGGGGGGSGTGTGGTGTGGTGTNNSSGSNSGAGSASSSGSNWTPNSGYGNWIPVDEGSNCPNKYRDANGQWWCSGGTSPQQGSAGSAAAGTCDPTATNYWACINSGGSAGSSGSAGATSSDGAEGRLNDKGDELIEGIKQGIDDELSDYEQAYTDDIDAFVREGVPFDNDPSAIKSVLISFLPVSTPCNPPKLQFFGRSYDLSCEYFNIFKQALGWFLAILTAFQIWRMAIRPVER